MTIQIGQKAPDATLVDGDCQRVRLSQFLGGTTVLAFFPGAFSDVCTLEMRYFSDHLAHIGARVIGVSADTPFAQVEFVRKHRLHHTLLSDFNHEAMKAYGAYDGRFLDVLDGIAKRAVFVIDPTGTVVYTWMTDNPRIEPPYKEVAAAVRRTAGQIPSPHR